MTFINRSLSRAKADYFNLFAHDCCTNYVQLLANDKKCKTLALIEEGMASYLQYDELLCLHKRDFTRHELLCSRICYDNRIQPVGFAGTETDKFSITQDAFPGTQSKMIFDLQQAKKITSEQGYHIPNDATILIHDASSEFFICSTNDYIEDISRLLTKRVPQDTLYYKFHPSQSLKTKSSFVELLQNLNIRGHEIPPSAPIEFYILSDFSYNFLGIRSSCLFYAQRFGNHNVFDLNST